MKTEIFKGKDNQYYFTLKGNNNEIIATSGDGYKTKQGCLNGIDVIKKGINKTTINDKTKK